ncbi:MAG: thioredoxin [Sedimentisphaerales bacterium]|nr:thioredoxin [Sedimentisphaerales bacterium]
MAGKILEINEESFDATISQKLVLIDFWAPWCGPCLAQGPILEEVATAIGDTAVIAKVNVDNDVEIATRYGIQSIPTIILFKDGKVVQQFVGVQQKDMLLNAIKNHVLVGDLDDK